MFAKGDKVYRIIDGIAKVYQNFEGSGGIKHLGEYHQLIVYCNDGCIRIKGEDIYVCDCKNYSDYEPLYYKDEVIKGLYHVVFPDVVLRIAINGDCLDIVPTTLPEHMVNRGSPITSIARGDVDVCLFFGEKKLSISGNDCGELLFSQPDISNRISDYFRWNWSNLSNDGEFTTSFNNNIKTYKNVVKVINHRIISYLTSDNELMEKDVLIMSGVKNAHFSFAPIENSTYRYCYLIITTSNKLLLLSDHDIINERRGKVILEDATGVVLPTVSTHDYKLASVKNSKSAAN